METKMINANFEEWFENGLRFLRCDPALTDLTPDPNTYPADFLKAWDALDIACRSFVTSVFRAAPQFKPREVCGTETLCADDIIRTCVLWQGHGGFCDPKQA